MTWTEKQLAAIMADMADENAFACQALFQITGTRLTTGVDTLAVTLSDEPMLLVNPDFLRRHAHTEADIRCFLLHEFLHVILRHTETYEENTPLLNIALDAVINAIIHRSCGAELSDTLARLYPPDGLASLLRPWGKADAATTRQWKALHGRIYSGSIAADDLHELLEALISKKMSIEGVVPIGNHSGQGEVSRENAERLDEIVKRMTGVRIWNHRQDPGTGDRMERLVRRLRETRIEAWRQETATLVDACLQTDPDRMEHQPAELRLPILSPRDRRAFAGLRHSPFLPLSVHGLADMAPALTASVYLDVSGSMDPLLDEMASLLSLFQRRIRNPLWTFSNEVSEARIHNERLLCSTTQGTGIGCVFDHIREQGTGRTLIVTDGHVEKIRKEMLRDIDPRSLRILVTPDGSTQSFDAWHIPCHRLKPLHT